MLSCNCSDVLEAPNPKLQAPEKFQTSSSKGRETVRGLELGASLELGAFCIAVGVGFLFAPSCG
jgi:hypothetical protein